MRIALIVGFGILFGLACYLVLVRDPSAARHEPPESPIVVPPGELLLGDIVSNTRVERELHLHNRSMSEVNIVRFDSACGCVRVVPDRVRIAAQATLRAKLVFEWRSGDTADEDGQTAPFAVQPFAVSLVPVTSADGPVANWKLLGRVHHLCAFPDHAELYIPPDETPEQGRAPVQMSVPFKTARTVSIVSARSEPAILDVSVQHDESGNSALIVAPRRDLKPGRFNCRVELLGRRANAPPEVVGSLPVRGEAASRFKISPAWASLGMVKLGTEVRQAIRIVPRSGESVACVRAQGEGAVITRDSERDSVSDKGTWILSKTINTPGSQLEVVTLEVSTESGESELLCLPIRYVGVVEE